MRGYGFNQNLWAEGYGSRADLDALPRATRFTLPQNPCMQGGQIQRRCARPGSTHPRPTRRTAKLCAILPAAQRVSCSNRPCRWSKSVIPPPSLDDLAQAFRDAQRILWSLGITGVHDYDRALTFSALQELDKNAELGLRVVKSIPLELLPQAVALGLRSGFGSQFLRIGSVKLFADGALGPHTAAMLQPYEGDPGNTGILFLDNEQIYEYGQQAVSAGISMAIHAIGDRANHEVLQAFTQLRAYEAQHGLPRLRHRIEHVQCLHPQDSHRLAELDVIASVQPIHATSDMFMADQFWGDRSAGAYAYRTLIEQHTRVAFGSDAPVELPNPWLGLHAAVTRQRPDASPGPQGWYPQQRLSLQEALSGFTTGPAYAAGLEDRQGCLAPGFYADLIVLDQNPFTLPPQDLHAISPVATMVGGNWVWQRE